MARGNIVEERSEGELAPASEEALSARCLRAAEADPERPTAAAVDVILDRAAAWGASDVHVSPTPTAFSLRFRLDGVLCPVGSLPRERLPLLVQRIKVLAGLLTYRSDVPQDGRVARADSPAATELRVAVLPTLHGERAVIRLLDRGDAPRDLECLGWPEDAAAALRAATSTPQGLVLFSGPAGSGKTTTIYAALRALVAQGGRSCVSIEDPVEAALEGVDQTPVDRAAGLSFAVALRALLRHDPEVLFVGEIRDRETARTAVEAGLSGHLVLSTVHAGGSVEALTRLLDLQVEAFTLTSTLRSVFAQRLVRRRCATCLGAGADCCRGTGYRGRLPLVEFLTLDATLRRELLAGAPVDRLEATAAKRGLVTLAERGRRLVTEGATTEAELRRTLGLPAGGGKA